MATDQFCLIIGKYFKKAFLRGGGLNFNPTNQPYGAP
jgi:hypothetical protein